MTTRVLYVDDERFMRQLVAQLLRGRPDTQVETVDCGTEALRLLNAAETPFNLLICDLNMPEMSGFDIIAAVRASSRAAVRDIPVIVLTGNAERSNVVDAMRLGISGFLAKPFTRAKLEDGLRNALGG